jgi:MFS family permease
MRELGRYPDFIKLLVGQGVSEIGSVATRTALPIAAVVALGAGPLEMGILVGSSSIALIGVGLAAGAWVDRLPRRPVMIAADLGRAAVIATIPVAAVAGVLTIELLYVVAFASAALGAFFDAAYRAYPPVVVPRERLVEANSALSGASNVAEMTGPSLAGALVQLLSAPFALLIDAISFVVSAISLGLIRTAEPPARPAAEREPLLREISAGLGYLARERSLRVIALSAFVGSFFGTFFASLYTLYAIAELGISPFVLGVIISAGGVGGLVAVLVAGPLARRFGIGPTIVIAEIVSATFALLIPLAGGPWAALYLFIPQLVGDGIATVAIINAITLRQTLVPPRMLGRVNATMNVLLEGVAPVGAVLGALIAEAAGIRVAVWVAVLGGLAGAFLMVLPSPLLRTRDLPEPVASA